MENILITLKNYILFSSFFFFFKDFIYLFEREGVGGRGRSNLPAEQEAQLGAHPRTPSS